jgi:predicted nucleic acid-binding protein
MNGVILDSDILIELLRGRNAVVRRQFESLLIKPVPLFYSAVSSAEIANRARESESDAIAELLALFTCVPADCGIAAEAGDILKRFRKSHLIGLGDALIGATVLRYGLQLWTRNRKHYPDVRLEFFESAEAGVS